MAREAGADDDWSRAVEDKPRVRGRRVGAADVDGGFRIRAGNPLPNVLAQLLELVGVCGKAPLVGIGDGADPVPADFDALARRVHPVDAGWPPLAADRCAAVVEGGEELGCCGELRSNAEVRRLLLRDDERWQGQVRAEELLRPSPCCDDDAAGLDRDGLALRSERRDAHLMVGPRRDVSDAQTVPDDSAVSRRLTMQSVHGAVGVKATAAGEEPNGVVKAQQRPALLRDRGWQLLEVEGARPVVVIAGCRRPRPAVDEADLVEEHVA